MTNEKIDQQKITEAGTVELEEGALDQASGGLNFSKIEVDRLAPTGVKIDQVSPTGVRLDPISPIGVKY